MSAQQRLRLAPLLLALVLALPAQAEISVADDSGRTVRLATPARRIVSLAPHVAELIYAAGAGDRLVGTVQFSTYPEAARRLPQVGGYSRFDLEAILALKPDLVIGWQSGNPAEQIARMQSLGLPLFLTQPDRIDDVARNLEQIGTLAGTEATARAAAAHYRARHKALAARYSARPPVRVFYQVWKTPLMTVGGRQIISDVLTLCGGRNVFADLTALAPTVNEEAVLAADPEVIIASGMDQARPEWVDDWRRWPTMTAVARGNLFHVPPELIQRHTPRLLDGAEQVCGQLEQARSRRPAAKP
ncbi:cobalamin-binding protein [Denitratisoma oestradiolicum]|uniref:Cobalamin-binding protein n=1 Tax=Denitratisoma oestradiolicum TaxID=311182 RepID=A0A6S6Y5J1_9PROT|nr:cobalamin-binding protein [Denitratisoma oestradiolicum]CAB1367818.1 Cobalamin-binding protein [Denitratisoma oestradiolicum]